MTDSFPRLSARTQRFTLGAPRNIAVSTDGERVVFLRSPAGDDPTTGLWLLDVTTGHERQVVDPTAVDLDIDDGDLPAAEQARRERLREGAGGITSFDLDGQGEHAVFTLGGQLVVAHLATGDLHLPTAEPGAYDPRLNAAGTHVAYVADGALRVTGPDGDAEIATDPDPDISSGVADFAAAEELGRTRGHWWSPDGTRLLAARVDNRPVATWYLADPTEPATEPRSHRYPAAGTANANVSLHVFDLDGSRTDLDVPGDKFEYLVTASWRREDELTVSVLSRDQRTLAILAIDPSTGGVRELRRLTDPTWVDVDNGAPAWAGDQLVTIEPRDGTNRMCLDGEPASPDGLEIDSVVRADSDGVTVIATTDPIERHVVRVGLDGSVENLTIESGVHRAVERGSTLVVTTSTLAEPGATTEVRRDTTTHVIATNAADPPLRANVELLELGSNRLRSALLLPSNHDGTTTLPVLLDPYGGPHAQRVIAAHNAFLASQWFADQGFAVLVVDGRGTPGRGPEWDRSVHGDLAQPVLDDQIEALNDAGDRFDVLDLDRVAIRGWSFGGYLAALAVIRRPDVFHAAVAGAPVTDWRLYDTAYTERYLGNPSNATDAANYERTDLVAEAAALTRPLMLIHGLADDNVVAAHTLQLSRALLAAGRPHEVLPLSGVSHMTPQEVVAENLLLVQVEFLHRSLEQPRH